MKNIVITAGGTIESIDEVRKITNTSSGRLGCFICEEIMKQLADEEFTIHYVMSLSALKPKTDSKKIRYYGIRDTQSLIDTIDGIFMGNKVDYFIHSMAVSDFTADYTVSMDDLAGEIWQVAKKECSVEDIKKILENPKRAFPEGQKISSKEDILLGLKRTSKVISQIKKYDKDVFLVGFKLLNRVSEEELVEVAAKLEKENGCDLVLANDLCQINDQYHKALLIEKGKVIQHFQTKLEIAEGLVEKMFRGGNR